jgi:plastocyanin
MAHRLLTTLVALALLGTVAPSPPLVEAADDDRPTPPRASECVDATEGVARFIPLAGVQPDCLLIDNGDRVVWENRDHVEHHDPGDGDLGDDGPVCIASSYYTGDSGLDPAESAGGVGETFSLNVRYDGDDINFTDIHFDGQHVDDWRRCHREVPRDIYQINEDGDVAIHYIGHIHEDEEDGWILLDVT